MEGKRFKIFDSLVKRMRKNKKLEIGVYAAIAIAVALIYITSAAPKTSKTDDKTKTAPTNTEYAVSERELERRLESILSSISGAGNVRVMITYDTTSQMVPALSTDTQKNGSESNDGLNSYSQAESSSPATVSGSGGNSPIIITEILPKIRGVIVIAEGAANISIRLNLQYAVQTVLGIDASCVEVFEMGVNSK